MRLLIFLVFLSCAFCSQCGNYTTCPSCGWDTLNYSNDNIAPLDNNDPGSIEFRQNANVAIDILQTYGTVITDDSWLLHTTIQYLCCYSLGDYRKIAEIIKEITWQPLNLTFEQVVCNQGGDDDASSKAMNNFVQTIENAMIAGGISVHSPRSEQEPFHSTLAVVTSGFPVEEAMQEISQMFPVLNTQPIVFDHFFMEFPFYEFYSVNRTQ